MKHFFLSLALVLLAACCKEQPQLVTLSNTAGTEVKITNFGARLVAINLADKDGIKRDVLLGFDNLEEYYPENNQTDFGAAIGRYANRIQNGKFSLDGVEYDLPKNNYGHCLHGGPDGWQYRFYTIEEVQPQQLKLSLVSKDGDSGFPGEVKAFVTYTLTDDNRIEISYEATANAPTIINMTNHAYFNLSGQPESHRITEDSLYINASAYTPVDDTFMTTGEILPVAGTPMDFSSMRKIGESIDNYDFVQLKNGNGYDHNWVLDSACDPNILAAKLYCPATGIALSVYTNEPGIQIYSGNFLDGSIVGKGGVAYHQRSAICLETQHYPDSPNKPEWPSPVLRPGETYRSFCAYAFTIE